MAQPTTAKFGKMLIELGEPSGTDPAAVTVTSLSNTNPARCTVGAADIAKFQNGMIVVIAGATGTGMTNANGSHAISSVGTPANTFTLTGVDTSTGAAPQTTGVTADPPAVMVWAAPCGFTSKGVTLSKNLSEVNIPDCTNPDAPIWIGRDVTSQSAVITGDGVAAGESLPNWDDAFMNTEAVPMRVTVTFDGLGTKVITGMFHVDSEAITVEAGGRVNLAINAQSDGAITADWTPAP
jgi:Phage tail tube protein